MSILKVNTGLFFVLALTISGGVFTKKLLTPHPRFHPLLSKSLKQYPGLKFHPHSEHYIYKEDTVEMSDKSEFKALASKLSQLPSNFPSKIILATVPAPSVVSAPSVASSTDLNTGNPLTNRELYLISKYWLQLLPQFHPELLKCLAGPTANPSSSNTYNTSVASNKGSKDQFPSNCPSSLTWPQTTTKVTSSSSNTTQTQDQSPSFLLPSSLYTTLNPCPSTTTQQCKSGENCYCTKKSCTNCSDTNSCKCYSQSDLTTGPRFFKPEYASYFSYPNPSDFKDQLQTFNATTPSSSSSSSSSSSTKKPPSQSSTTQQNYLKLPHFSFPLPHSSYTNPQTQNTISDSETPSLNKSPHWPQSLEINPIFSTNVSSSLDVLVSKLLSSPSSFPTSSSSFSNNSKTTTLTKNSPTQLFFVRYLATLYALLWSYSPDTLPLFPSNYSLALFDTATPPEPLFNTLPPSNPNVSEK